MANRAHALILASCVALVACDEDPPPAEQPRSQTSSPSVGGRFPPGAPSSGGVGGASPTTGGTGGGAAGTSGSGGTASAGNSGGSGGSVSSEAGEDAGVPAGPAPIPICEGGDDGGVPDEEPCLVVGDIRAQYRAADTNAADNGIKPHFNLFNDGAEAVPLSRLTLRYWFRDGFEVSRLVFWCDYAQIDCGTVRGAFASVDQGEANRVLEITFTGGSLAGGASTGEIQTRFNRDDWSLMDESDDPSFDPTMTAFGDAPHVTLYLDDSLIWGIEPR